jgi:membrane protein YqaA with SNARE-associated domain
MRDWLYRYRIELKYTLITGLLLGGLALLTSQNALGGAERAVNDTMIWFTKWGYIGMFIIGVFANVTLVILIPYALPLMTLSIYADSVLEVIGLGTSAGIGSGIGELASYAVAHTLVKHVEDLEKSSLFRWTKRTIEQRPSVIPLFVWLASATPAPDAVIIVPLAMVQYPWRKMIVPMIGGKIVQNVYMALIYRFFTAQVEHLISDDINFDTTATFAVIFVAFIAYQIEKARAENIRRNGTASAPEPVDAAEPEPEQVIENPLS